MFAHEIKPINNGKPRFAISEGLTVSSDTKLRYALILGSKDPNTGKGWFEKVAVDQRTPPNMTRKHWNNRPTWTISTASFRSYALPSGSVKCGLMQPSEEWMHEETHQVLVRINTHMKGDPSKLRNEGLIDIITPSLAIRLAGDAYHWFGSHRASDWLLRLKPGAIVAIRSDHVDVPPVNLTYDGEEGLVIRPQAVRIIDNIDRSSWLDRYAIDATRTAFACFQF